MAKLLLLLFLLFLGLAGAWYVFELVRFFTTPGPDGKRPSLKQFWQWNGARLVASFSFLLWGGIAAVTSIEMDRRLNLGPVVGLPVGLVAGFCVWVLFLVVIT